MRLHEFLSPQQDNLANPIGGPPRQMDMEHQPLLLHDTATSTEMWDSLSQQQGQTGAIETTTPAQQAASLAAEALTTQLQQEANARRNETLATVAWSGTFLVSMLWLIRHMSATESSLRTSLFLCFALMGSVGWGLCFQLGRRSYRRKRSLTDALARINDKTQVSPLIQSLQVPTTAVRSLAKQSLTALLPTLRAGDASLLDEADRKVLLRQLAIFPNDPGYRDLKELFSRTAYRREMDLRLAILKALEQVGGEQELAAVERLARGLPTLHSTLKVPREIREAAKACLPYLHTRADDQRAEAQLLRASCLPQSSGADLLRPVSACSSTPPEQLLRAGGPAVNDS